MKKFLFILLISLIPNFLIAQALTCDIKINNISYSTYSLCVGDWSIIKGNPAGGTLSYTHQWTGGGVGQLSPTNEDTTTFTAITPGTYTVVYHVTDATPTTITDTIIITVNPLPNLFTLTDPSIGIICIGDCADLTAFTSSGDGLIWYQDFVGGTILSSTLGDSLTVNVCPTVNTDYYALVYIASTGCTKTKKVTVTANPNPTVSISASVNPICAGTSTILTASGASNYSWSDGLGTTNPVTVTPASTTIYTVTGTTAGCTATASITITVNNLTVSISASENPICAGTSTTLTASGASNYSWSNGLGTANPVTVTPASTTTYTVTGTATGCTGTASITVTVNPNPTISISASATPICAGTSTTLTASGATTYSWGGGLGTANPVTVTPASTTTYTVTGITAGCTGTASVTVTVIPLPNTLISAFPSSIICSGNSSTLTALGGGTYTWGIPPGGTDSVITVTPVTTTTYTVTVTKNGCYAIDSVTVVVMTAPLASITANPNPVCDSSCSVLTASGGNGYQWGSGPASAVITVCPDTATTYTVTVTQTGCTDASVASITVTVNPLPAANAGNDTTICQWASVQLNGSGAGVNGTYSWSPVNYLTSPVNISNPFATPSDTIVYFLTVTDTNGCINVDSVTLNVLPFTLPVITSSDTGFCDTASVNATLNAGAGYTSYSWNTAPVQNTQIITVTQPGCFNVTVTAANGCTAVSPDACIQVYPPISPVILADGPTYFCQPDSVLLYLNNPYYTFEWSSGSINVPTIEVYETGDYYVTITDSFGCKAVAGPKTVTVDPLPHAYISYVDKDSALIFDFYSYSLHSSNFEWNFGDFTSSSNFSNSEDDSHIFTNAGIYTVMLIVSNYCGNDTAYATVVVHYPYSELTGCSDISNFILYPNPTKGVINLDFTASKSEQILLTLFDALGRLLYRDAMSYYSGEYHKEINIESLPKGMYVLRITTDKNTYNNRIIKD